MTPAPYDPYEFIVRQRIEDALYMKRAIERASLPFYAVCAVLLLTALIVLA
jgi:hypothetical protein